MRAGIHLFVTEIECAQFAQNRRDLWRFRTYFTRVGSIFTRGGRFHSSSFDRLGCVLPVDQMLPLGIAEQCGPLVSFINFCMEFLIFCGSYRTAAALIGDFIIFLYVIIMLG